MTCSDAFLLVLLLALKGCEFQHVAGYILGAVLGQFASQQHLFRQLESPANMAFRCLTYQTLSNFTRTFEKPCSRRSAFIDLASTTQMRGFGTGEFASGFSQAGKLAEHLLFGHGSTSTTSATFALGKRA